MKTLRQAAEKAKRLWKHSSNGVRGHLRSVLGDETEGIDAAQMRPEEARMAAEKTLRDALIEAEAYARHMERRDGETELVSEKARLTLSLSREPVRVKDCGGNWCVPDSMALKSSRDVTRVSHATVVQLGIVPEKTDYLVVRGDVISRGAEVSAMPQSPQMLPRVWLEVEVKGHTFSVLGAVSGDVGVEVGGDIIDSLFAKGYVFGTGAVPSAKVNALHDPCS